MRLINVLARSLYNLIKFFTIRHILPDFASEVVERLRTSLLRASGARIGLQSLIRHSVMVKVPANLMIGENVKIAEGARLYNFSKVVIGDNVEIGPELHVYTNEHIISNSQMPLAKQGSFTRQVKIGKDCYLGARVTILSGVTITDRCVIGAGSVVTGDLEQSGVYCGSPAALKRNLSS